MAPLAEITMADPHFETLLTDCPGQFWKADVVNFSRAPKLCGRRFEMNAIARERIGRVQIRRVASAS